MKRVYQKVFKRCGLTTLIVEASGGTFSKYSHEFQVLSETGEDTVYYCSCGFAQNKEIVSPSLIRANGRIKDLCPRCKKKKLEISRAIEVGNIFKLGTKYSEPFDLKFKTKSGEEKTVIMGCYGIGLSRVLGAIAEVSNDEKGIIWPENVAPFAVHLLKLTTNNQQPTTFADKIYSALQKAGIEVLYDDRNATPGEKFADADLIGIPYRAVISEKTGDKIEIKKRGQAKIKLVNQNGLFRLLQKRHRH